MIPFAFEAFSYVFIVFNHLGPQVISIIRATLFTVIVIYIPMFIMHLYKNMDEIPKRDEQILGGTCAPLTGSESWFDKFFLINFLWL